MKFRREKRPETAGEEKQEIRSALEVAMERIARMEEEAAQSPPPEPAAPAPPRADAAELEKARKEAAEYLTALQYKSAEFDNFRKRTRRELEERARRSLDVAELLPLLDDFERARQAAREVSGGQPFLEALEMLADHLAQLLAARGVERKICLGEPFDPRYHEAMMVEEHSEFDDGRVCRELSPLYLLDGETLRPARVVVCQKARAEEAADPASA